MKQKKMLALTLSQLEQLYRHELPELVSIAVRAFLRRKRGNRQHGQHHQSSESTGKKTVISLFHAKNLLCVHTDAKEA